MAKKVAILAASGYEKSELEVPYRALSNAGMKVYIVSPEHERIRSWDKTDWGNEVRVDIELNEANPSDFDALVLPGGVMNPDNLRKDHKAVAFVRSFFEGELERPVGAICHAGWMLAEADVVKNRKLTSYKSIHTDLANAGALWTDEEVVVDGALVTSRGPDDLDAFTSKLIEAIEAGPVARPPRASGYVDHYASPII